MKTIHSQVAAILRAEGIKIDDREAAIASLKECVAPNRCVAALDEILNIRAAAAAVHAQNDMNCIITVSRKHGHIGFRFDPSGLVRPGHTIDGPDGQFDVLDVIERRGSE